MRIVLFEPDIPQNAGSLVRLCACTGVALHVIEPCGFIWDDKRLQRVAMDYYERADITRHASWEAFCAFRRESGGRLLLLTTKADALYTDMEYRAEDMLLLGRESSGVPAHVRDAADARIGIPMRPGTRSLNVALAAAMVLGEALRQTR